MITLINNAQLQKHTNAELRNLILRARYVINTRIKNKE